MFTGGFSTQVVEWGWFEQRIMGKPINRLHRQILDGYIVANHHSQQNIDFLCATKDWLADWLNEMGTRDFLSMADGRAKTISAPVAAGHFIGDQAAL